MNERAVDERRIVVAIDSLMLVFFYDESAASY